MSYNTGNIRKMSVISVTLSPTIVAQNTSAEQSFTVNGLQTDDHVTIVKPTAQAGLGIVGARAGTNLLYITFMNATGSGITPTASEVYKVLVARKDSTLTDGNLP